MSPSSIPFNKEQRIVTCSTTASVASKLDWNRKLFIYRQTVLVSVFAIFLRQKVTVTRRVSDDGSKNVFEPYLPIHIETFIQTCIR